MLRITVNISFVLIKTIKQGALGVVLKFGSSGEGGGSDHSPVCCVVQEIVRCPGHLPKFWEPSEVRW